METKNVFLIVVLTFCLSATLFVVLPSRSASNSYDPWADVTGPTPGVPDGTINMRDIQWEILHFNTFGTPIDRTNVRTLAYDSGWVDATVGNGPYFCINHNLNLSSTDVVVDARGRIPGWDKTYGTPIDDGAECVIQTSDSGYAFCGYMGHPDPATPDTGDAWLVKTDSKGNMLWNTTLSYGAFSQANCVIQTTDGNYAITGYIRDFARSYYGCFFAKIDAEGNILWNKVFNATGGDLGMCVIQTSDGFVFVGGTNYFTTGTDFWLVKTDPDGNMLWNKTYGGTNWDECYCVTQTNDDGYALCGYTDSYGAGYHDFWIVKTDASGNMLWNTTAGYSDQDWAYSITQTSDLGYVTCGYSKNPPNGYGSFDGWIVKTDASGNLLWNKTYGGSLSDYFAKVIEMPDKGLVLGGYTSSLSTNVDSWLVRTDDNGNMLWNKTFGGSAEDTAFGLCLTNDGGYVLAGSTQSYGAGGRDAWLVKTDIETGLTWTDITPNTITLLRTIGPFEWTQIRLRLWLVKDAL